MKIPLFLILVVFFFGSCSLSRRINKEIRNTYKYNNGKMLGGNYVYNNRKIVLNTIHKDFLRDFDSLILIEKVVYLEDYYDCSIFEDSLTYFFQAKGLAKPKRINLKDSPHFEPKLPLYIFEQIRKGELIGILKQGENVTNVHPTSIFLTIVKRDGNKIDVKGYDLNEFIPREKLMERDSIKREIKRRTSNR
jgi:hypothetical protein